MRYQGIPHSRTFGSSSSGLSQRPTVASLKEQTPVFWCIPISGEICECLSIAGRLMKSDSWDGSQDG